MKTITKDNFNFDKYDEDRIMLNEFISYIAYHGLTHLKNFVNYPKVNYLDLYEKKNKMS